MKYPVAFNSWYKRAAIPFYQDDGDYCRLKRVAYKAWQAGRKHQKGLPVKVFCIGDQHCGDIERR